MKLSPLAITRVVLISSLLAGPLAAEAIRFERESGTIFLECTDVAAELGFEFKVVDPERLLTFCQGGANGICIPVRLTEQNHRRAGTRMLVAADVLARALRCRVSDMGKTVSIAKQTLPIREQAQEASPAYNAAWGRGRGFRKGETLPDIPLVDLEGNEVRFSHFLGKRYILYCWASW